MPAQNALSPVPVRTTARMSGSLSAASMARPIAVSSSGLSELRASGRLSRKTVTAPRRSVDQHRLCFRLRVGIAHQATTFLSRRSATASAE